MSKSLKGELLLLDKDSTKEDKDDSFDAEFSLLESTLTELKDREQQADEKNIEKHRHTNNTIEELGEVCTLTGLGKEISTEESADKPFSSIPLPCEFPNTHIGLDSFGLGLPSLSGRNMDTLISSTSQHLPTDVATGSSYNPDFSMEPPVNEPKQTVTSNTENENNINWNSLIQQDSSHPSSQTGYNISNIPVSHCGCTLEVFKQMKHKAEEKHHNATVTEPIVSVNADLGAVDKQGLCPPSKRRLDLIQCSPAITIEPNEPDILNLEYSPIPSPNPPNIDCSPIPNPNAVDEGELEGPTNTTDVNNLAICITGNWNDAVKLTDSKYLGFCEDDLKDSRLTVEEMTKTSELPKNNIKLTSNCQMFAGSNDECPVKHDQRKVETDSGEVMLCNVDENVKTISSKNITDVKVLSKKAEESKGRSNIFCSTPIALKTSCLHTLNQHLQSDSITDLREGSSFDTSCEAIKKNLKRKNLGLECIEEVDEDASDIYTSTGNKKLKVDNSIEKFDSETANDQDTSSASCFEPPAKSILKKWQLGCLSRNSGSSSFLVLDECGERDLEDIAKRNEDVPEPASADDFEVACKSLTEELIKSSSNIETLEKYYSQVQLESQMDDEKFDEVLQELTLNYELDEKTSLSHKSMEEGMLTETNKTLLSVKSMEESLDNTLKLEPKEPDTLVESLINNTTKAYVEREVLAQILPHDSTNNENLSEVKLKVKVKDETHPESSKSSTSKTEVLNCSDDKLVSGQILKSEKVPIVCAGGKDMTMDEEDVLLEEDVSARKKPYVFFEFVSSDPKENEDNYNPEWQKLGRLTSDEERYKAVRDRWRSLVPPDPNRDLTCRQWRERNHKPPLNLPSLNINYDVQTDSERNQLCTAVFEYKIKKMVQELESRRMNIVRQRNIDFEDLALAQDEEQRLLAMRGGRGLDMIILRKHHLEECRNLKNKHDLMLKQVTNATENQIRILKDASEEVLLFQKFYKGVGADDDEVCLYSTDTQIQELMETEDMLEQYTKFYQ